MLAGTLGTPFCLATDALPGRHAFGTIVGLHQAYRGLPKVKKNKLHAHLTLLDIHDATVARDLTVLMLLHDLSQALDTTTRAEITATLMYVYCGAAMPSYCYDRFVNHITMKRGLSSLTIMMFFQAPGALQGLRQTSHFNSTRPSAVAPCRL